LRIEQLEHDPMESDHVLISLFEHDLRANASRLSQGKTGFHPPAAISGTESERFR
jgi:hypothetical protein